MRCSHPELVDLNWPGIGAGAAGGGAAGAASPGVDDQVTRSELFLPPRAPVWRLNGMGVGRKCLCWGGGWGVEAAAAAGMGPSPSPSPH